MKPLDPFAVPLAGTNLIEASAGTGKTHTITTLYVRLLLELRREVGEVLVVTYTNAAAAELRSRIRSRLRQAIAALKTGGWSADVEMNTLAVERVECGRAAADEQHLLAALRDFDDAAISTIHGFCQRVLVEHAFESASSFAAELVADQTLLRREVGRDFWTRELYRAARHFVRYLERKKESAEELDTLAAKALLHARVPVLPASVEVDLAAPMDKWEQSRAAGGAIWKADREEILDLLCAENVLKRTSYAPDKMRRDWGPQLDLFFSGAELECEVVKKLTPTALKQGTRKGCRTPAHPFFHACGVLAEADEELQQALEARLVQLRLDLVRYARDEMRRRKRCANVRFFDDLLLELDTALAGPAGAELARKMRARFPAALIDEFQDTDPLQYGIFRRVYGDGGTLFLIGDPKQAVYAFRGADVFSYIHAKADAAGRTHTLVANRRSGPGLLRAINTLFGRARSQFIFDEIGFAKMEPAGAAKDTLEGPASAVAPLQVLFVPRAGITEPDGRINKGWAWRNLPSVVSDEIVRWLESGSTIGGQPVQPSDIAVLCRKNRQALAMQEALRAAGVPNVLYSAASVFDTQEAEEIAYLLRAMTNPSDAAAVRWALATTVMGFDGNAIFGLQEDEGSWEKLSERFRNWYETWLQAGFMAAFRRLLDEQNVEQRVLALADGERRLTNLFHLGELLHRAAVQQRGGPLRLVEWLRRMQADAAARGEMGPEATQIRLESDERALKLITIHKSKGLEFPVVYAPFLWEDAQLRDSEKKYVLFHDGKDENRLKLDVGSPERERHQRLAAREALAESLRLLYVALTRAQHRCVIVWGAFKDAENSPLGYLLHQPAEEVAGHEVAQVTAARIRSLEDGEMRADLDRLAVAGGSIEVADLPPATGERYLPRVREEKTLCCREMKRTVTRSWRTSSFSGLVSEGDALGRLDEEGLDRDETAAPQAVPPEAGFATQDEIILHNFPAGVRTGHLVHEVFEHLDFAAAGPDAICALVEGELARHGFDLCWAEPLCRAIAAVLETALDEGAALLKLSRIGRERRLNELEFMFPVAAEKQGAGASPPRSGDLLTGERIAAVFAEHGRAPLPDAYAARVRSLGFDPLAGYLRGFIDLVFEHEGRWYVVDYKTNRLGSRPEDYRPECLLPVMAEHHYFLQYHLYLVALHHYLGSRLREYDYDRHFGGVYYLFVRGMSPAHERGCGVFRDRPRRALVEALAAVLSAPGSGT